MVTRDIDLQLVRDAYNDSCDIDGFSAAQFVAQLAKQGFKLVYVEANVPAANDSYFNLGNVLGITREELMAAAEYAGVKVTLREHDRGDGRKAHYGPGRQPLDDIKDDDCAGAFSYANILKYLRRAKDISHSYESSRFYYNLLEQLAKDDPYGRSPTNAELYDLLRRKRLTSNELAIVTATKE